MTNQPQRRKKVRAANWGPKSPVGQARYRLYVNTVKRVNQAVDEGYYLEAITLLESLIADRLEARRARIHKSTPEKREFSTLGRLVDELRSKSTNEPEHAREVYEEVRNWSGRRNAALHEFAKLQQGVRKTWKEKYEEARLAAVDGLSVFRKLDAVVKKLNKKPAG